MSTTEYSPESNSVSSHKKVTLCRVCDDVSSGRHYGVYTCDGCSGFFMRSVRRKVLYACKGNGQCIVDKKRRNQCQACRFSKCIQVKMNRYAVQQERQPNSTRIQSTQMSANEMAPYVSYVPSHAKITGTFVRSGYMYPPPAVSCGFPEYAGSNPYNMLRRISMMNQPPLTIGSEDIYDASARIMFLTVKWARSVPAFADISSRDQIALLEVSWRDLFVLLAIQWDLKFDVNALVSSYAASKSSATDEAVMANIEVELKHLQELQRKFKSLKTTDEEYLLLKAVTLFKPEARGIDDPERIEQCQDQAQLMLAEQMWNNGIGSNREQAKRFGKFLLMLPSLQMISKRTLEDVFFRNTIGSVSMEKILSDLLTKPN